MLLLVVAAVVAALGRFIDLGRDVTAVGGNRSAARFAGLDVDAHAAARVRAHRRARRRWRRRASSAASAASRPTPARASSCR